MIRAWGRKLISVSRPKTRGFLSWVVNSPRATGKLFPAWRSFRISAAKSHKLFRNSIAKLTPGFLLTSLQCFTFHERRNIKRSWKLYHNTCHPKRTCVELHTNPITGTSYDSSNPGAGGLGWRWSTLYRILQMHVASLSSCWRLRSILRSNSFLKVPVRMRCVLQLIKSFYSQDLTEFSP